MPPSIGVLVWTSGRTGEPAATSDDAHRGPYRQVHAREGGIRLRLAVLEHLDVRRGQVGHRVAPRVGDRGIDFDVVHRGAEDDRRGRGLLAAVPRRQGRRQMPATSDA